MGQYFKSLEVEKKANRLFQHGNLFWQFSLDAYLILEVKEPTKLSYLDSKGKLELWFYCFSSNVWAVN